MPISFKEWLDNFVLRGGNPYDITDWPETYEGGALIVDRLDVTPSTSEQIFDSEQPYDGYKKVVVSAVTNEIDANIIAENIKKGVSILGVEGNFETPIQASKTATPTTNIQIIRPDNEYQGLEQVVVGAVDPTQYYKPEDKCNVTPTTSTQKITPEQGHVFNEVTVNAAPTQTKIVTPTTSQQTVTPTGSNVGFSSVIIKAAPTETRTVTPTSSQQVLTPSSGKVGFSRVTVNAVNTGTKTVYPTKEDYPGQSADYYSASSDGYTGYSSVYVNKINSSIDSNIQASNIKKDITILGVTGTLEDGGIEEVSELPTVGEEDKIYRVIETEVSDEGNYTISNDYNFESACSVKFGNYIYFFNVRNNMSMSAIDLKYSIENKTFTQLDRSLVGYNFNKCAIVGNYIYLFNAENNSGTGTGYPIYKFDPSTDTYIQTNSTLNFSGTGGFHYFYCQPIGTNIIIGNAQEPSSSICVYDTINDSVIMHYVSYDTASNPYSFDSTNMYDLCSISYNNSIYIFGLKFYTMTPGATSNYKYYVVKLTEGNFGTFNYKAEAIEVSHDTGIFNSCGIINNKVYIFGGYKQNNMASYIASDNIYEFDLNNNSLKLTDYTTSTECMNTFTYSLGNYSLYIMAEKTMTGSPSTEATLRAIYIFSSETDSDYVYRNNAWLDIINGGGGTEINIRPVTNLSISGTVLSWTAADIHELEDYNPTVTYIIKVDDVIVTETANTSCDIASYITSSSTSASVYTKVSFISEEGASVELISQVSTIILQCKSVELTNVFGPDYPLNAEPCYFNYSSSICIFAKDNSGTSIKLASFNSDGSYRTSSTYSSGDLFDPDISSAINCEWNGYSGSIRVVNSNGIFTLNPWDSSSSITKVSTTGTDYPALISVYENEQMSSNKILYIFGGETSSHSISNNIVKAYVIDGVVHTDIIDTLPQGVSGATTIETKDYIYILGGWIDKSINPRTPNRNIFRFIKSTEHIDTTFTKTIPNNVDIIPGMYNRSKSLVIGNRWFVYGGDNVQEVPGLFEFDTTTGELSSIINTYQTCSFMNILCIIPIKDALYPTSLIFQLDNSGVDSIVTYKIFEDKISLSSTNSISSSLNSNTYCGGVIGNYYYMVNPTDTSYTPGRIYKKNLSTGEITLAYDISNYSQTISGNISKASVLVDANSSTIYIAGGEQNASLYSYNVSTGIFSYLGDLISDASNKGIIGITLVMSQGALFMFGGAIYSQGSYSTMRNDIQVYSGGSITTLTTTLPTASARNMAVLSEPYVFLMGGYIDEWSATKDIYKYNIEHNTIETLTISNTLSLPRTNSYYLSAPSSQDTVLYYNNKIYISYPSETSSILIEFYPSEGYVSSATELQNGDFTRIIENCLPFPVSDYFSVVFTDGSNIYAIKQSLEGGSTSTEILYKFN